MARAKNAGAGEGVHLSPFEGKDVLSTAVMVTKAGDGLSKALAVEPREMHVGETGVMVLEFEVGKVRFDPVTDTSGLQRVHVLVCSGATFIDEDVVREALDAQARKIDAAAGVYHLPFAEGDGPVKPDDMSDEEWEESGRADAELAAAVAADAQDAADG